MIIITISGIEVATDLTHLAKSQAADDPEQDHCKFVFGNVLKTLQDIENCTGIFIFFIVYFLCFISFNFQKSRPGSASKQRDKSMDPIAEVKDSAKSEAATNDETRREDRASSGVSKKVERRSERQRVKRQIFSNGQSETKDDSSEGKVEQKRRSLTPRITVTSDYSSEEGEKEDPPSRPGSAYEIYKQAGEWWK